MTNRNDDDFNFDDDLFGTDPTPSTDADLNFDDDPLSSIGSDDFNFDDDDEEEGGRTNRTFVVLAFIIILLFIAGVVAIVLFALNRGPTDVDRTRTAIAIFNVTQQAFLDETGTASFENAQSTATAAVIMLTQTGIADQQATGAAAIMQTQAALDATQTALAQPTASPTPSPTVDITPDMTGTAAAMLTDMPPLEMATNLAATQTQEAADALATQEAINAAALATQAAATLFAAQTEAAENPPTATGQVSPGGLSPEDIRQTATALSQTLSPVTPVATEAIGGTPVIIVPTRLPETGLFDDIAGGNSFGVLALVALGLVGVIFGARKLRK